MNRLIKSILINIKKKKLLSLLRFGGLAIGFAVALYIFELVAVEESYDRFWEGADNIYRVALDLEHNGEQVASSARNFRGAPYLLKEEIPGIESCCAFGQDVVTAFVDEKQFNEVNWIWSDTTFFRVFDRKILIAENDDYFGDLHGVLISESFARKLYGDENPIGKKFKVNEGWEYIVKAVFEDIPSNSHFAVDAIGSYATLFYYMSNFDNVSGVLRENPEFRYTVPNPYEARSWNAPPTYRPYCYIKLAENTSIQSVIDRVPAALEKVSLPNQLVDSKLKFNFQPVRDIHLHSNLEHEFQANGSESRVRFLYITAFVVLLICAINFINLSMISTIENGKQFAIRTINGAKESGVFRLLVSENLFISIVSLAIAFVLFFIANQSTKIVGINLFILAVLALILLATSVLSAVIPYLTALKGRQQSYLKSQTGSLPGMWSGRKVLVLFQFAITTILIVGTILINKQLSFMTNYELAFKPESTMYSTSPMSMNMKPDIVPRLQSFRDEVMAIPGVNSFAVASSVPGKEANRGIDRIWVNNAEEPVSCNFSLMSVSNQYLDVFDIKLLSGRNFRDQSNWNSEEVIISKSTSERMGFKSPADAVGAILRIGNSSRQVVGVFNDYHHLSLKNEIPLMIMEQNLNWNFAVGFYSINFNTDRTAEVLKQVSKIWEKIYPGEIASFNFTDQTFAAQYDAEQRFNHLLSIGSIIALAISCIGLFAISAFDAQKRRREVGVRKVNGAKSGQILFLLNADILKWVAISFLIAIPAAWFAGEKWLEGYAYKTELSWWIFALAGVLALGIALLTVSWQSWRAATRNPVEALRYE